MRTRWQRWRRRILVGIALIYLVIVFVAADWLVLMPLPGHIDAGPARREVLDVDGRSLECWVCSSQALADRAPQGYVLEFCGNATRAETIAQYVACRWRNYPLQIWVINYPGVGGSTGWARMANISPAALAAYDAIARRANGKPVFVEANSVGTVAALCVAARRDVAGCVLHDPLPLRQFIISHYGWWNLWLIALPVSWRVPSDLDSLQNARQVAAPCVFIVADKDDFVLPKFHQMVIDAYPGPKKCLILRGKGHWDGVGPDVEGELQEDLHWLWDNKRKG